MRTNLREGFTTGTATAAAATAAVALLLGGTAPSLARVPLLPLSQEDWLDIAVESAGPATPDAVLCGPFMLPENTAVTRASVIKDAGDDPDVTHGARLAVYASIAPFPLAVSPGREYPVPVPVSVDSHPAPVTLYGGRGVGVVTLPGLPVAPGEPAVNPGPRQQIAAAARRTAASLGYAGPLHLLIAVPDGEALAKHTLNARLGILGGISILGTRGTVRPFSHESWQAAIAQGISVAAALGLKTLLLSTGRRSEKALFSLYPELPATAGVQAADFAAFSIALAAKGPFQRIAWGCFPGKLLKLAQGMPYTHARSGSTDISLLSSLWLELGGDAHTAEEVNALPTAAGALTVMSGRSRQLHDAVLEKLARRALAHLRAWAFSGKPSPLPGKGSEVLLHVFTLEGAHLVTLDHDSPGPDDLPAPSSVPQNKPTPLFVAGLGLSGAEIFRAHPIIRKANLLVGGKEQLAPLEGLAAEHLVLGARLEPVLDGIRAAQEAGKQVAVLCSGDPLFYGLGSTLLRQRQGTGPAPAPLVLPGISSLQAAAALIGRSWERVRAVSLHGGRDWLPLAHALLTGEPVFILTDGQTHPGTVAEYLLERGRAAYDMHVITGMATAPNTGLPQAGDQRVMRPEEALSWKEESPCRKPRVIWLEPLGTSENPPCDPVFGLPDTAFARENDLLTKRPIRAAAIAAMAIAPHHVVWDLGAGSGSVGIEASRLASRGLVVAVERRTERVGHIRENRRRFGAANLEIIQADLQDALEAPAGSLPHPMLARARPHAVFLGGGLAGAGQDTSPAHRILRGVWKRLLPGGRLVVPCVLLGTLDMARHFLSQAGADLEICSLQASQTQPLAGDLHFRAMNPVFLLTAAKPGQTAAAAKNHNGAPA